MNAWQRWTTAPHTLLFRRLLFQVHLWLGIGFGLYVLFICVTGSVFILNPLLQQWLVPNTVRDASGAALRGPALDARIAEVYAGYDVVDTMVGSRPEMAVYVTLQKDGIQVERFFDHYSGEDLGNTTTWQAELVTWLVNAHDDLLIGRGGRQLNGVVGGGLFLLMSLSGLVVWWQGSNRWYEGLMIRRGSPRGLNWQLHSFTGICSLVLMLAWGLSALHFAYPEPFVAIVDWLDPDLEDFERPNALLDIVVAIHVARYQSTWALLLWAALGLLPGVMFVTGFILWWRRVVRKRMRIEIPTLPS
jgi:uncharacterized iron-regulated membrane protein